MDLNNFVRDNRKAHGYNQREFAALLKVDFMWLSKLENGRVEPDDPLIAQLIEPLAEFAQYNPDWLRSLPVVKREPQGQPAFVCRVREMATEQIAITSHNQLNTLIAQKVMGLKIVGVMVKIEGLWRVIPDYSADLNAAEEAAKKCECSIGFRGGFAVVACGVFPWRIRHQSTAIAICLAALKAQGLEVDLRLPGNQ